MEPLITGGNDLRQKKEKLFLIELLAGGATLAGTIILYFYKSIEGYFPSDLALIFIPLITLSLGITTLIMGIYGSREYKEKKFYIFGLLCFLAMLSVILVYLIIIMFGIGLHLSGAKLE